MLNIGVENYKNAEVHTIRKDNKGTNDRCTRAIRCKRYV